MKATRERLEPEIEITKEMIEAGVDAYRQMDPDVDTPTEIVMAIYSRIFCGLVSKSSNFKSR
jgi:hypothetical protein